MTDKEKYEALVAEIDHQKEETSIGLNEWENGEEHGRMDVINALQEKIKSMQGEPVSEDLEEAAKHYLYSNILYDDVYVGNPTDKDCIEMFKAGANLKEQQLMAKAFDVEVKVDAGGYPYIPQMELYDYEKDIPLAKEGDKYKVFLIKE